MKSQPFILLIWCTFLLGACASLKEKKSSKYYFQHEKKIGEILVNYDSLYKQQAFNLGFSERDYSRIGLDIITDTIRYALTNQQRSDAIKEAVRTFGYDTVKLRKLYTDLYDIRAIWLGRDHLYHKDQKSMVTYLSFRSVAVGNPFLDRKYYALVMLDPAALDDDLKNILARQGYTHIKDNIYFSIIGRFR
jgi:hypothetical protein